MPSKEFSAIAAVIPTDFADPDANFQQVRDTMAPYHGHPVSAELLWDIHTLGAVRCGYYRYADTPEAGPVVLYVHGGGLVSCPLDAYHFYAEFVCRELGMPTWCVDYRLAPEAPFPAATEDCLAVYRALLGQDVPPSNIVVVGESCGGGLAINALLLARDEGLPMPAAFVSLTGWFDLSAADESVGRDPFLTPQWVRNRGQDFVQGQCELNDPRVSPCYADLTGLPPLYLQIGECDTMAGGARRLARRAVQSGVPVMVENWPSMVQGWHGLLNAGVPEARDAWANIRTYLRGVLRPDASNNATGH